ncbi:LrgB family protein [Acidimangrovimonas sediminis]|uniref:LrgB family protein n=1 Tax=Acidimangrovimonas sediminis TaxID=2056283 RepID=UPI0018EC0729|nr:LrgB family protein [Acidimangrovimonas sediminis]
MPHPMLSTLDPWLATAFWSALTIAFYLLAKRLYRRWPHWLLMPLALTPALLIVVVLLMHASYGDYMHGAGWLLTLLGPATVAFAVPIYEQRALIRREWPVLAFGMVAGSLTAIGTSWLLATLLGLNGALRLSLLPRSISTPFAMQVSQDIGGVPNLTAVFVVLTGVFGAVLGDMMLTWLPIRSSLARGAVLAIGAHGAGTARANQLGVEEGSIAGLLMVLVGLLNVLVATLLAALA